MRRAKQRNQGEMLRGLLSFTVPMLPTPQLQHGQLGPYAHAPRAKLAIFYPALPGETTQNLLSIATWNETYLHLIPLQIVGWDAPGDALPSAAFA